MKRDNQIFVEEMKKFGLSLTESQLEQFEKYYDLLIEKNEVMNLTAITDYDEVLIKHFADSLSLCTCCDFTKVKSLLDVGTGAGFPGICIAIMFPKLSVTLIDSLQKRVKFLEEVIELLGLNNCNAYHERAEEWIRKKNAWEKFDICTSRAVAKLVVLAEYCIPYVKLDGYFLAMKSVSATEEIAEAANAIKILGGITEKTIHFKLGEQALERNIVMIRKEKKTTHTYPRTSGKPLSKPL